MKIVKSIISTLLVMCMSLLVCATQLKTDVYAISNSEVQNNYKKLINAIKEHGSYDSGNYVYTRFKGDIELTITCTSNNLLAFGADLDKLHDLYSFTMSSMNFTYDPYKTGNQLVRFMYTEYGSSPVFIQALSEDFNAKDYYHGKFISFYDENVLCSEVSTIFNDRMSDWNAMLNNLGYSFEEIGFLNYYGNYTPEEPTTEEPTTEEPTTEEPTTEEPTTEEPTTEEPTTEEPTTEEPTTEEPTTEEPTTEEPTTEEPTTEEPTTDSDANNGSGGNNGNNNNNDDDDSSAGNVGAGSSTNTPLLVLLLFASVAVSTGCILVRKK